MRKNRVFYFTFLLLQLCLNGCAQNGSRNIPRPHQPAFAVIHTPLRNFFGINAFEWDFEDPTNPMVPDSARIAAIQNFTGIRHYMDWEKIEPQEGHYTFCPVHNGGWNYDTMYQWCKTHNTEVLACLKGCPPWMQETYPKEERDGENVPMRYGKNKADPSSYIEQARAGFQYAARYGGNKNIDPNLVHVDSLPRWTDDPVNKVRIGLDLVHYIECDNERDKWWKGKKAYQSGAEYAANLSAFYDGNKNTMGPGVGVKNADPEMKVVMAGLSNPNTAYIQEMTEWCKAHRGYKPDGSVDLPWDVINYHYYCDDATDMTGKGQTAGMAPETGMAETIADSIIELAHLYARDMPVWVTEAGYDINQQSIQKAIPIKNRTAPETQADWILRTSLLYARAGIQKVFFYQLYDDNAASTTKFATCGLVNANRTRRPAADFLYQTNKLFGSYTFSGSMNNDPVADKYSLDSLSMYVLLVPDQKGRTTRYTLDLGNADTAYIYSPNPGRDDMALTMKKTTKGKIEIPVTETPLFVTGYRCGAAIHNSK